MFLSAAQAPGRFVSSEAPLFVGPRNCGQSSAAQIAGKRMTPRPSARIDRAVMSMSLLYESFWIRRPLRRRHAFAEDRGAAVPKVGFSPTIPAVVQHQDSPINRYNAMSKAFSDGRSTKRQMTCDIADMPRGALACSGPIHIAFSSISRVATRKG